MPNSVPIMVLVDRPMSRCCIPCLNIPNGVYTISQAFGVDKGLMQPGLHCCFCTLCDARRVTAMITKNTIRFQCPIHNIPTKDNVMVSIDVGVNFHIGNQEGHEQQEEDDLRKFFYNFGPNRLEELLQQECEEGIRNFIRQQRVMNVRDVKTEVADVVKDELASKFQCYGVVIEQVNIMNIILPRDMRIALMAATNYDVYLQK